MLQRGSLQEWRVVYTTYNNPEAHIVAGRLESEGIPAMVQNEPAGTAIGITVGPLGENKVVVHVEDYDRALAILYPDEPDVLADDNDKIIFDADDFGEDDGDS
ncbi:MAG: DUF2007 domain-containing protein [Aggregatilineales bacterium]